MKEADSVAQNYNENQLNWKSNNFKALTGPSFVEHILYQQSMIIFCFKNATYVYARLFSFRERRKMYKKVKKNERKPK